MELKRLESAIASRWMFVAGMAILGVAAAMVFGNLASSNQERVYEATAAIRFEVPEGGTIADLTEVLSEARNLANLAAGELLGSDPTYLIVEDLANARLNFVAQGSTQEEAIARAEDLRQAFLEVDPLAGGGSVDGLLRGIEEQATEVQAALDSINAGPTPEQQQLAGAHATLDESITAINTALADLLVQEAAATDAATREAIADQSEFLGERLSELSEEKAALDPLPRTEVGPVENLRVMALQAQMEALIADYQRLSLRQVGVTEDGALEQPVVQDLTPDPANPMVQAAIGLIGGLLVAVLALIFLNRTRRPIWIAEDLPVALLEKVPARRFTQSLSENWYQTAEPGPRKSAIQALRSTVEANVPATGATIAITGLEVSSEAVQALASDLASSLASAGTSVLLVDANFQSKSSIGRYQAKAASLAHVLGLDPKAPEFVAMVAHTVENAPRVAPGLAVLPSGPPPASPADKLAGRQFRQLVADGQKHYDVVVVVVDDAGTPAAQVAMQRLGFGMVAVTPGVPTVTEVNEIARGIERLGISMLGVVFLPRARRFFPSRAQKHASSKGQDEVKTNAQSAEAATHSPVSRLHNYPIPAERTSALVPHKSLKELATAVEVGEEESSEPVSFGQQLVAALEHADREPASEAVADYVLSETRDMVLAYHAFEGVLPALTTAMSDYGFMSLIPLKDFRTPAAFLEAEVASEVGDPAAVELVRGMERVLGAGREPIRIDAWLDREFFARHLERSDGEPSIWHLVSPERAVSLLVPARRLSRAQLELIRYEVVSRTLDELERYRDAMAKRSNLEQEAAFEGMIEDTREFERALTRLIGDGDESGRAGGRLLWQPDWSKGTRANLAPIQAAGLLPFDVLDPEEMSDLLAS